MWFRAKIDFQTLQNPRNQQIRQNCPTQVLDFELFDYSTSWSLFSSRILNLFDTSLICLSNRLQADIQVYDGFCGDDLYRKIHLSKQV